MSLANLLDQTINLSPSARHAVRGVMRWGGAVCGLCLLGWVLARADHLTVRKEAKTAKQEAQVAVDRTANFGRIITDGSGRIISWNRGMSATTGWRADEMIGKNIADLIAPEDAASKVAQALVTGGSADGNVLLRRAGSKSATVLIKAHVNTASDFRYVLVEPAGQLNSL